MKFAVSAIEGSAESLFNQLENREWYAESLAKMSESRQQEWLAVRVLLRQLLGEEKEIRYLPSGKPYLADGSYRISVSHTRGFVAVIADEMQEVAVDIEYRSDRVLRLAPRFLSEEELNCPEGTDKALYYLIQWSAKESIFKILNRENVEFKTQIGIENFRPTEEGVWGKLRAREEKTDERRGFVVHYLVAAEYILTLIVGE